MMAPITAAGGRIDHIYFSPYLETDNSPLRKPGIGMALQAKDDFPEINFSRSIMVGDTLQDMEFGRLAGMWTVWVGPARTASQIASDSADGWCPNLAAFAAQFRHTR